MELRFKLDDGVREKSFYATELTFENLLMSTFVDLQSKTTGITAQLFAFNSYDCKWQLVVDPQSQQSYSLNSVTIMDSEVIENLAFNCFRKVDFLSKMVVLKTFVYTVRTEFGEKIPSLYYKSPENDSTVWPIAIWVTISRRYQVAHKTLLADLYSLKAFYNYCAEPLRTTIR